MKNRQFGFTLLEILISVAIVAILASIAAPSLSGFFSKAYVRNAAKALEDDIRLGGIEARTRVIQTRTGSAVILCPYNTAQTACADDSTASLNAWQSNGWLLFVDRTQNNDYNFDASQPDDPQASDILINATTDYAGKNYSLTFATAPDENRIVFGASGVLDPGAFQPITISDARNIYQQQITIDTDTGQTLREQL